jgi:hypothetical protein
MRVWLKSSKARRVFLLILILLGLAIIWSSYVIIFNRPSAESLARILILDDCDRDFRNPPFEDCVYAFSNGKLVRKVFDLSIAQTVGGCRRLSTDENGRLFLVCENVGKHLNAYNTQTGERIWRLDNGSTFQSATVSRSGAIYALTSTGTIYGAEVLVINERGDIEKTAPVGGFDLVVDDERKALWMVGKTVKKCDLTLNVLWEQKIIGWCAVSVDLSPDGSTWVAEREHPNVSGSQDRLLKISPGGEILKTVKLDFSPSCVRVDHASGNFWVTGGASRKSKTRPLLEWIEKRTGRLPIPTGTRDFLMKGGFLLRTEKRDGEGKLLRKLDCGGATLAIDPADNSVWVTSYKGLYHFSADGAKRGRISGLSDSQSYVVALPNAPKISSRPSVP